MKKSFLFLAFIMCSPITSAEKPLHAINTPTVSQSSTNYQADIFSACYQIAIHQRNTITNYGDILDRFKQVNAKASAQESAKIAQLIGVLASVLEQQSQLSDLCSQLIRKDK